ncbi:hypothetical protein KGF57_002262 [Candida theae]|uniref:Uncharacterized protein n=1 Tax=Candida theae TaxID=1198502 RepID=A0AAD5BFK2_9ASCO|nr:uncharacterized protein KGF57_002262 [Candida theae]KAI5958828.1 hypothetical protein KGF57_002262 [Candida theae]
MRYKSRLKQILSICSLLALALVLYYHKRSFTPVEVKPSHKFDLIKSRNTFQNPVFAQLAVPTKAQRFMSLPLQDKCDSYFKSAKLAEFDVNFWNSFQPDPHVYKRKKWIRDRTRSEKRKYKKTADWKEEYDQQIALEFADIAREYSGLEERMFGEVGHMKVFGKCFASEVVHGQGNCEKVQQKLYPWLTNRGPLVTTADGEVRSNEVEGCVTQSLVANKGQGIVIPTQSKLVENVCRLINSLIALENKLPIEIAYLSLSDEERVKIVSAARNSTTFTQQVSFVDLKPTLQLKKFPFLESMDGGVVLPVLSLMFNSFGEVILLTEQAIPLSNLESLFQNIKYKSSGRFFFRSRPFLDREKFTPGFHEITALLKHHLPPSSNEVKFFNMSAPDSSVATSRFFKHSFRNILDTSVIVMNKSKSLSGLLITVNLHFYNVLKLRLTHKSMSDLIWIGQEVSGQEITFNNNYPVIAGIYTPDQNLPRDAKNTYEICSSSFAQLSETDDVSLLYITSDQLQNALEHPNSMKHIFEQKYVTKYTELVANLFDANDPNKTEMTRVNYNEVTKLSRNPLLIEHIIKPPTLTSIVYVHHFEEPNESWVEQSGLVSERMRHEGKRYYCAYDTVGNPMEEGVKGVTINIDDESFAKYDKITKAWMGL